MLLVGGDQHHLCRSFICARGCAKLFRGILPASSFQLPAPKAKVHSDLVGVGSILPSRDRSKEWTIRYERYFNYLSIGTMDTWVRCMVRF